MATSRVISMSPSLSIFIACTLLCCQGKTEMIGNEITNSDTITPIEVQTVSAVFKPFENLVYTSGKVESSKEVSLQFNVSGLVTQLMINSGQFVNEGQLLALIDNKRYKLEMDKAEIVLKEKQLVYENDIEGFKHLGEPKLKTILNNIFYSSGLAFAEISFQQAKLDYENTFLRSSISGLVSNLDVKEGNTVKPGDRLCLIHDPHTLTIACDVLESDILQISKGQTAIVQPLFNLKTDILAKVSFINPRVDVQTGLTRIFLSVAGDTDLLPGMNVNIQINIPMKKNIIVPTAAIVIRNGRKVVFVFENGAAKWNYVETGRENGEEVEIIKGLIDGQKVIITNNLQLAHDAIVVEKNI